MAQTLIPKARAAAGRLSGRGELRGAPPLPDLLRALPAVEGAWPELPPDRPTAFVCCDPSYLQRHGLAFARSLDRNSPGLHLHVHLINPDLAGRAGLESLALANTSLSSSAERADLAAASADFARTYCASIRFVRQYQLLASSGLAVFAFDVDVLVRGSLDALLRRLLSGGYDCAVHTRLRARRREEKFLVSAFYAAPTLGGRAFLGEVAARIAARLRDRRARWYMDQLVFYDCYLRYKRARSPLRLYALPKAFSDWNFAKRSTLWVAKGWRKEASAVFRAHQDAYRTPGERISDLPRLRSSRPSIGIVLPRLDLPFRAPRRPSDLWSLLRGPRAGDRLLRDQWTRFAQLLEEGFRERGCSVRRIELPLWQVTREAVEDLDAELLVLPHKQAFDFPGLKRPAWFYMQQALPWLFSLDRLGWSGGSSLYPCDFSRARPSRATFECYVERVVGGNVSKYAQPPCRTRSELVSLGEIPADRYIFVPCQRPDDLSIRLFFDHEPEAFVSALADWARARGISLVFKAHPTNPASALPLRRATEGPGVTWSTASIHDLIAYSAAVYVINSGTGLEALLHDKPVATFGRTEYDAVTLRGDLGALDRTWQELMAAHPGRRRAAYRRFVDWYCRLYCVDLSDPAAARARLAGLMDEILETRPPVAAGSGEVPRLPEAAVP